MNSTTESGRERGEERRRAVNSGEERRREVKSEECTDCRIFSADMTVHTLSYEMKCFTASTAATPDTVNTVDAHTVSPLCAIITVITHPSFKPISGTALPR
jgi:hypothetical protein